MPLLIFHRDLVSAGTERWYTGYRTGWQAKPSQRHDAPASLFTTCTSACISMASTKGHSSGSPMHGTQQWYPADAIIAVHKSIERITEEVLQCYWY